jgi:hypothetical protein
MLTPADHRAEDIALGAIIVPELKLRNVQREMFVADFVERANDAANT